MTTYRKLERSERGRVIWKPTTPGETLEGTYQGSEPGDYNDLLCFHVPGQGRRKVPTWATGQDFVPQLKLGHAYRLTFTKMVALKSGNQSREIDIEEIVDDDTTPGAPSDEQPVSF